LGQPFQFLSLTIRQRSRKESARGDLLFSRR
jgi:hypothetical protein